MRSLWAKWAMLCACAALTLVALTPALRSDPTAGVAPHLSAVTITDQVDASTKAPLRDLETVQAGTPILYAAVRAAVPAGTLVAARWYIDGNHVPGADFAYTFELGYRGWISPSASLGTEPWPPATYTVAFYVNGKPAAQKEFQVK